MGSINGVNISKVELNSNSSPEEPIRFLAYDTKNLNRSHYQFLLPVFTKVSHQAQNLALTKNTPQTIFYNKRQLLPAGNMGINIQI